MSKEHDHQKNAAQVDSGSQALSEALHSSFAVVKFVMGFLVVLFFLSGIFTVGPQEKAIKLRFGKPQGEGEKLLLGAGLHWALPYPIDEVVKIPITEIQTVKSTVGWFQQSSNEEALGGKPQPKPSLNPEVDGYVLTADGNILHSKATLSYRIEDPVRCVFDFTSGTNGGFSLAGVSNAVQNTLNNALVQTAARYKVDDILLRDAFGFQEAVKRRMTALAASRNLGITVEQCVVDTLAPGQLDPAFQAVNNASQNRAKLIAEAQSYHNQVTNQAGASAVALINTAESDRQRLISEINAEAKRFKDLLPVYEANPRFFSESRLVEIVGRSLTNSDFKAQLPLTQVELRLLLNREPPKPKPPETK